MCRAILFLTFLGALLGGSTATEQCNVYNFAMKGAFTCGLQWWQKEDLGQIVDFPLKLSDIVTDALADFFIDLNSINSELMNNTMAQSVNPFAKIIESAAVVEPYILYIIADLLVSQKVTPAELSKFGLPPALAERSSLIELYTQYFQMSCGSHGVGSFVDCMDDWMTQNCSPEDQTKYISDMLNKFRSTYCVGDQANETYIQGLNNDLGTVYQPLMNFLGIVKDDDSDFLFNLTSDSIITSNSDVWGQLTAPDTCMGSLSSETLSVQTYVAETSTRGAGGVIRNFMGVYDMMQRCYLRMINKVFPQFITDHQKMLRHLEVPLSRVYILARFSMEKTLANSEQRYTAAVFGDPHLQLFRYQATETCALPDPIEALISIQPDLGRFLELKGATLLANDYFILKASTQLANQQRDAEARIVSKLVLEFLDRKVMYTFSNDTDTNSPTVSGHDAGILMTKDDEGTVQIIDESSGTVFLISKYKKAYIIVIRMGEVMVDSSLGALVSGCPVPTDANDRFTGRMAHVGDCQHVCEKTEQVYQLNCLYDCDVMQDTKVPAMYEALERMKKTASGLDAKVLSYFPVIAQNASSKLQLAGSMLTLCIFISKLF